MSYKTEDLLDALKAVRSAQGVSQRALSQRTGLNQSHISKIESRALEPSIATFVVLARALDLEPMLIPRKLVPAVEAIVRSHDKPSDEPRRAYLPDEEDDDA